MRQNEERRLRPKKASHLIVLAGINAEAETLRKRLGLKKEKVRLWRGFRG